MTWGQIIQHKSNKATVKKIAKVIRDADVHGDAGGRNDDEETQRPSNVEHEVWQETTR